MPLIDKDNKFYTYADIKDRPEKWEIIEGNPCLQASPSKSHQHCAGNLFFQFMSFLKNKACKIYYERNVWLDSNVQEEIDFSKKYIIPDLVVICDKDRDKEEGIFGVPNLIIEVLSPSTIRNDVLKKFNQYLKVGLKYYWIIDPMNKLINVYTLKNGEYTSVVYDDESKISVDLFNGELEIDTSKIFLQNEE